MRLQNLALSYNALGTVGLERLLGGLPCRSLGRLELGSVAGPGPRPLTRTLCRYLAQVRAVPEGMRCGGGDTRSPGGAGWGSANTSVPFLQEGCILSHLTFSGNRLGDSDILEVARWGDKGTTGGDRLGGVLAAGSFSISQGRPPRRLQHGNTVCQGHREWRRPPLGTRRGHPCHLPPHPQVPPCLPSTGFPGFLGQSRDQRRGAADAAFRPGREEPGAPVPQSGRYGDGRGDGTGRNGVGKPPGT